MSRRHLQFNVNVVDRQGAVSVQVCDLGSKSGTTVNGRRIEPQTNVNLSHGDTINVASSISYIIERRPVVLSVARTISSAVERQASMLGFRCVSGWTPECTHRISEDLTVTSNIIMALLDLRPIVLPSWLKFYADLPTVTFEDPDNLERFLPPIPANQNRTLNPQFFTIAPSRKTLFSLYTFLFTPQVRKTTFFHLSSHFSVGVCRPPGLRPQCRRRPQTPFRVLPRHIRHFSNTCPRRPFTRRAHAEHRPRDHLRLHRPEQRRAARERLPERKRNVPARHDAGRPRVASNASRTDTSWQCAPHRFAAKDRCR